MSLVTQCNVILHCGYPVIHKTHNTTWCLSVSLSFWKIKLVWASQDADAHLGHTCHFAYMIPCLKPLQAHGPSLNHKYSMLWNEFLAV